MSHSGFVHSLQLQQTRIRSSPSRQSFAVAMVVVALVSLSWEFLRVSGRTPETPVSSSGAQKAQAHANPPASRLQGGWNLLWKDPRGVLLTTHCQIFPNGSTLTIYMKNAKLLNADARTPVQGIVENGTISFRVHPGEGNPIVFIGKMDNDILHGTTSRGFSWMAIRDLK